MKKYFSLCLIVCSLNMYAQTPNKMSYQAVIRNAANELVTNAAVGMRISILQGSASGKVVYSESHTPTTNQNGLISLEIGGGTVLSGAISNIDWSDNTYFVQTETDTDGGTNYQLMTTSQLLSVPYALHAKTAATVTKPVLLEPYILGTSTYADNASFYYNKKLGWQGANEACKDAYPNERYARAFTMDQITQALTLGNFSDNQNYNDVPFWIITSSVTKGASYNGSGLNNAANLSDGLSGVSTKAIQGKITFDFKLESTNDEEHYKNGPLQRFFTVEQDIFSSSTNLPCLCGTYKPAEDQ